MSETPTCVECLKFVNCDIPKMSDINCILYPRFDRINDCFRNKKQ